MTDQWEFFPCTIENQEASIFYDHGIKDTINDLDLNNVFKVKAQIKSPSESGLTTQEEYDEICELEDLLIDEYKKNECIMVGRLTYAGFRYFTFYTNTDKDTLADILGAVGSKTGYHLEFNYDSDPEKSEYWDILFPTKDDQRVIFNIKTLEALREAGDNSMTPRKVDHWAYFKTKTGLQSYCSWLENEKYSIAAQYSPDKENDKFGVQFNHVITPDFGEINEVTRILSTKAEELGGSYDGWGTTVEK